MVLACFYFTRVPPLSHVFQICLFAWTSMSLLVALFYFGFFCKFILTPLMPGLSECFFVFIYEVVHYFKLLMVKDLSETSCGACWFGAKARRLVPLQWTLSDQCSAMGTIILHMRNECYILLLRSDVEPCGWWLGGEFYPSLNCGILLFFSNQLYHVGVAKTSYNGEYHTLVSCIWY
jgi:hypothetical protein